MNWTNKNGDRNINGDIAESALIYLSNQTVHGWYGVIPGLLPYFQRLQTDMSQTGDEFQTSILYGNAPFHAYACELANHFGITIQCNTTASGEGKWLCDQIGGTVSQYIQHGVKTGKIKIGNGQSAAAMIAAYGNEHFRTSKTDSIKRYFYELDVKDIKVHSSPVKSLSIGDGGISDYHCSVIKPGNNVWFRKYSCFCNESIESKFANDCNHTKYCGKWIKTDISSYPKYAEAVHKPKQKKQRKRKRQREEEQAAAVIAGPPILETSICYYYAATSQKTEGNKSANKCLK